MPAIATPPVYLFIDESGNFDFTATGTKYFVLTCVSRRRPIGGSVELHSLRYDLWEKGLAEIECFHASEDSHYVRAEVWKIVVRHLGEIEVDSLVVEKARLVSGLRKPEKFYPWAMSRLMRHVLGRVSVRQQARLVVVVTDKLPLNKHRVSAEKSIRIELSSVLGLGTPFRLMHHASMSNTELQIADYISWAVFRKWERDDRAPYDLICHSMRSEHDIFRFR